MAVKTFGTITLARVNDGEKGTPGKAGVDGKTPYLHTAYSWSADGQDRFMTVYPGRNYFSVSGFADNKYTGPYAVDYYDIQLLPDTKYTISTTNIRDDGMYDVFVGNKGFTANSGVNGLGATKPRTITTDSTGILTIAARNYSIADGKDKIKVELGVMATLWSPAPEDVM